jgi:hypothetical protein
MTERRKYIRLGSVFPVQFRITALDGQSFLSDWLQGFTSNVGKGGICLEVNNLKPGLAEGIKTQGVKLSLAIEMPLGSCPIDVEAKPMWLQEIAGQAGKYIIGLSYENIPPKYNSRIMRIAWTKKLFAPVATAIIIILGLAFIVGSYVNYQLIQGNKALVDQLVSIIQNSSIAKQKIKQINKEKEDLQIKIQTLKTQLDAVEEERANLKEKVKTEQAKTSKRIEEVNALIDKIAVEKNAIEEKLSVLQSKENSVAEELLRLDQKKATLEKANLDKMYQWLKIHQNPRTGLVMSFEGDGDIANWAFIYDQALAALAYTNFGDFPRAKKILNFFKGQAKRIDGQFLNAYYANDGQPAEYIVHTGPNIWLGIAIIQYTKKSQDYTYLKLAEEIASQAIDLQNQDQDGGLRGGPQVTWYATEHNLDAYAFFNMLYAVTGKEQYLKSRDKVLNWLVAHTYDKEDLPVKRGKGDSTIATDTYAWSIAAIGPEKLEQLGMNPGRILEFAEKNCSVEINFVRPEGKTVKVRGFDFAPQCHLARGGIVSTEWTAQMILSFRILADFYYKKGLIAKARSYEFKADEYLLSLGNMVISSPSPSGQGESCLPYATEDFVDTGHGWMTPKGKSTGSVAATAYTLFAYYKFNPLQLY